ncbi:type II secretion system F family protein [Cysteiniphilum halobium]|uniref:hypothetical protein n=1 Tax=Cysteiniphilum halobium TaxID=2219059 RepID=UPI000E64F652|nr:hypothetical protein [Cysteiniphilum halobium]
MKLDVLKKYWIKYNFSHKDKFNFMTVIYDCLNYGLSLNVILKSILPSYCTNKVLQYIYRDINRSLMNGIAFSQAIKFWYGETAGHIVEAGEGGSNANFAHALHNMLESLGKSSSLPKLIMGKITYGLTLAVGSIVLTSYFVLSIFPQLLSQLPENKSAAELPTSVSWYLQLGHFYTDGGLYVVLVCLIALAIALYLTLRFFVSTQRSVIDKLPIFKLYKRLNAANYMMQLGILFKANNLILEANNKVLKSGSPYVKMQCRKIQHNIAQGIVSLEEAFANTFFTPQETAIFKSLAITNQFENQCEQIGKNMRGELVNKMVMQAKRIGGVLVGLSFVNILWGMLAIYMLSQYMAS